MKRLFGLDLPISVAQVKQDTNFVELLEQHPWLNQVCLCRQLHTASTLCMCALFSTHHSMQWQWTKMTVPAGPR